MKTKKIAVFVLEELIRSGLITIVSETTQILQSIDYDVHVIYFENSVMDVNNYLGHLPSANLHPIVLKSRHSLLMHAEKFFKAWFAISRVCPGQKIDLFQVYLPATFVAVFTNPRSFFTERIYHFIGFRDLEMESVHLYKDWPQQNSLSFVNRMKFAILHNVQKFCLINSTKVLTISSFAKEKIHTHYGIEREKVESVYCTVNTALFKKSARLDIRKTLGISKDTFLITSMQRHDPRKGLLLFIKSLEILKKKKIPFHAIFAGDKTYHTEALMRYADECGLKYYVTFMSGLNREEVPLFYNSSDLSVISSLDLETFGVSMIEAFACGCVVVGTPTGSIPEVLGTVKSFQLCSKETTSESLAKKIIEYYNLPSRMKSELSKECQKAVMKNFEIPKISKDFQRFYSSFPNT